MDGDGGEGGQPGGKWEVTAPLVLPSVQLQVLLVQTASPDSRTIRVIMVWSSASMTLI